MEIFLAIYHAGSISRAARALKRPQPTVSNCLRGMRVLFHDALFVRCSGGVRPTKLAKLVFPVVEDALHRLDTGFTSINGFDASASKRNFVLAMTDIAEALLLPKLMSEAIARAPGVTFSTIRDPRGRTQSGASPDLIIGFIPDLRLSHEHSNLFVTDYACLVGRKSVFWDKPLTIEAFLSAKHAIGVTEGTGHQQLMEVFSDTNHQIEPSFRAPSFLPLPSIAQATDLIAIVPRPLANAVQQSRRLKQLDLPLPAPPISIDVFWEVDTIKDPAVSWLLKLCDMFLSTEQLERVVAVAKT